MKVTLPPSREPGVDPKTGLFSRPWLVYFEQMFTRVGGMAADLIRLADFTGSNQSLGTAGYQAFPGGLIRQWGTASTDDTGQTEITFPVPFETRCVSIKCEETGASDASGITFSHSTPTKSGATIFSSGAGTTNAAKTFDWEAIGY